MSPYRRAARLRHHAPRADVAGGVIRGADGADDHPPPPPSRVNEAPVAEVDADVGYASPVGVAEKDEIAGRQLVHRNLFAMKDLPGGGPRQLDAEAAEDGADEGRAVEAFPRCAAEAVGQAEVHH